MAATATLRTFEIMIKLGLPIDVNSATVYSIPPHPLLPPPALGVIPPRETLLRSDLAEMMANDAGTRGAPIVTLTAVSIGPGLFHSRSSIK